MNVVAESKLVRSNRASRLLRIEVQDLDDNQPIFSPTTPVSLCSFKPGCNRFKIVFTCRVGQSVMGTGR